MNLLCTFSCNHCRIFLTVWSMLYINKKLSSKYSTSNTYACYKNEIILFIWHHVIFSWYKVSYFKLGYDNLYFIWHILYISTNLAVFTIHVLEKKIVKKHILMLLKNDSSKLFIMYFMYTFVPFLTSLINFEKANAIYCHICS